MSRAFLSCCAVLILMPSTSRAQGTQRDLNDGASIALRRADSTLSAVYGQLVAKYSADTVALRKLRAAQQAWLAFRDADVEATFPAVGPQRAYGSVLPTCISDLLEELTKVRIAQLRTALRPQEGDVCAGGPA